MYPTPEYVSAVQWERCQELERRRLIDEATCCAAAEGVLSRIGRALRIRSTTT